jgi:hypothetical protein
MAAKIIKKSPPVKSNIKSAKAPVPIKNKDFFPREKDIVTAVLFFVILTVSYFIFLGNFFSIKELTSAYIKSSVSWIITFQFLLYTLIYGIFGYFAFRFITGKSEGKFAMILTFLGFAAIIVLHYLAFNKAFEDVDDNASYMIAAKSLVTRGAPYFLYMPDMKPDTEGAIGLPIMLIPFYLIWGMNYVPMEILIFFVMIGSIIMSFLLFRKMEGTLLALLITILFGTHPYIVSFSSIIMTEIPYIFWSLLALFLCLKFEESKKLNWFLLIVASLSVFMTYLTRAIGAGFFVAVVLYFLVKSNIWQNLKQKEIPFYKDLAFKKFILISFLLFVFMLIYQLWIHSLGGASQAETLAKMKLVDQFKLNFKMVWDVLSQNIFCGKLARYEVSRSVEEDAKYLQPVNILWALIFLITTVGLIFSLLKKQLVGFYFVFVFIILMFGNVAKQPLVISRYLIVFTPFLIYFLYLGVKALIGLVDKKKEFARTLGILVFCFLLGNSFIGDAFNVQRSTKATLYIPPFQAFLDCAAWSKDNIPKDAIVASRKERIFYVFSDGLRGYKSISLTDNRKISEGVTKEDYEKFKLDQFATYKIDYLILDTFMSSSIQIIYPIIQNNPDKFKLVKIIGDEKTGACYVFKIVKWWK